MSILPTSPVVWGILATTIVCGAAIILGIGEVCGEAGLCQSRAEVFLNSSPNEIGDALAGFAGTLAFIWIIVTVLLQSHELAAQRAELRLTREEFARQRQATEDMARALGTQAEIFEDERKYRSETRAEKLLQARLDELKIALLAASEAVWMVSLEVRENLSEKLSQQQGVQRDQQISLIKTHKLVRSPGMVVASFSELQIYAERNLQLISSAKSEARLRAEPRRKSVLKALHLIRQIIDLKTDLSAEQRVRLQMTKLDELEATLSVAIKSDIWASETKERTP